MRHRDSGEGHVRRKQKWGYAATSQRSSGAHRGKRRHGKILPQNLWRKHSPADMLILDFSLPQLGENKFLLFEATKCVEPYYSSFRKLIQLLVPRMGMLLKNLKMWKSLTNWIVDRGWKNFTVQDKNHLTCFEEVVGRNTDVKGDSGNGSGGSKE